MMCMELSTERIWLYTAALHACSYIGQAIADTHKGNTFMVTPEMSIYIYGVTRAIVAQEQVS